MKDSTGTVYINIPDMLGYISQEGIAVINAHKAVEDLVLHVGTQLVDTASALGVERDLVASVMVSEDEPGDAGRS